MIDIEGVGLRLRALLGLSTVVCYSHSILLQRYHGLGWSCISQTVEAKKLA